MRFSRIAMISRSVLSSSWSQLFSTRTRFRNRSTMMTGKQRGRGKSPLWREEVLKCGNTHVLQYSRVMFIVTSAVLRLCPCLRPKEKSPMLVHCNRYVFSPSGDGLKYWLSIWPRIKISNVCEVLLQVKQIILQTAPTHICCRKKLQGGHQITAFQSGALCYSLKFGKRS